MNAEKKRIYYLKRQIIFPHCTLSVILQKSEIASGIERGDRLVTYPIRFMPDLLLYKKKTATLSEVAEIAEKENALTLTLKGLSRVTITKINRFQEAEFVPVREVMPDDPEALREELKKKAQELIFLINVEESDRLISLMSYLVDLNQMTDFISNYFILNFKNRYALYRERDIEARITTLMSLIDRLIITIKKKRGDAVP
ncbi:MAG TPA: hypothetical protein PK926_17810 [Spirochaetota bacterium]|nr:hypothetical protein [Spirochaetota bacterium]HPI91359.1 hypothetical protein [Spirochaetota bacterium]